MNKLVPTFVFLLPILVVGQPSWTTPRPIDPNATRSQEAPLIAVSRTGTIAIVCRQGTTNVDSARLVVYRSTNNGQSFQQGAILRPPPLPYDWQIDNAYEIAYDTSNTLWLLWGWEQILLNGFLDLWRSSDDGISFTSVLRHQRALILNPSRMVIDRFNNIHMLRDSVVASLGLRLIYTRLNNGNPGTRFDALIPRAPDVVSSSHGDITLSQDSFIHYVGSIERSNGIPHPYTIEYSRSTNGGLSFSSLVLVDTLTPRHQNYPRITARDSLVLITYYLGDTPETVATHRSVVSANSGTSFSPVLPFGSHEPASTGRLRTDSIYIYALYPAATRQGISGSVYNKFSSPLSPPIEFTTFDSLYGDIAVSRSGGKYVALKKQNIASVLFSSKDVPTSMSIEGDMPTEFALEQNYPNPFNPKTTFVFKLPTAEHATLKVFNLLGREIASLVNERRESGIHQVTWDADGVSSGVYFYRMQAAAFTSVKKMMVLK